MWPWDGAIAALVTCLPCAPACSFNTLQDHRCPDPGLSERRAAVR